MIRMPSTRSQNLHGKSGVQLNHTVFDKSHDVDSASRADNRSTNQKKHKSKTQVSSKSAANEASRSTKNPSKCPRRMTLGSKKRPGTSKELRKLESKNKITSYSFKSKKHKFDNGSDNSSSSKNSYLESNRRTRLSLKRNYHKQETSIKSSKGRHGESDSKSSDSQSNVKGVSKTDQKGKHKLDSQRTVTFVGSDSNGASSGPKSSHQRKYNQYTSLQNKLQCDDQTPGPSGIHTYTLETQDTITLPIPAIVQKKNVMFDLPHSDSLFKRQISQTPTIWFTEVNCNKLKKVFEIQFPGLSDLWIEGLSFTSQGKLVVAAGYNIYMCDVEGHTSRSLISDTDGARSLGGPGDVTVLSNGHLAVTDSLKYDVKIYTCNGEYIKSIAGDTSATGITQNSKDEILVIDNLQERNGMQSVLVYSSSGDLLQCIENEEDYFKLPMYIATNSKDDIIVSDCMARKVIVFDEKGDFLYSISGCEKKKGSESFQFLYPCGVCVDIDDRILVVDRYGHCVHRLTEHGQYDTILLSSEDGLRDPRSITLDKSNNFLAIGSESGMVHIYNYRKFDVI